MQRSPHNHPEGIKGAQATAAAIFWARTGSTKEDIKKEIIARFDYHLDRSLDQIRPDYGFDVSCQGTVPESIIAFLESEYYEDAVRKAVSLGGDSDTLACITGGIAQAYYKSIPDEIILKVIISSKNIGRPFKHIQIWAISSKWSLKRLY